MLRISVLLVSLLTICIGLESVSAERFNRKFDNIDLFDAGSLAGYRLTRSAMYDKYGDVEWSSSKTDPSFEPIYKELNDLLVSKTDLDDPDANLDIVLEEFVSDRKNKKEVSKERDEGIRLLLSLRVPKGENECGYFSRNILLQNFYAAETDVGRIIRNENLNRIETILAHYIKQHIKNCKDVYFDKYDKLYKELNATDMKHLDALMKGAIETFTVEQIPENQGKSYVERLLSAASDRTTVRLGLKPAYVYNVLKEMVKGDPDEQYVVPVGNSSEKKRIRFDKFNRLYDDYVVKPCYTFRHKLGPEVFEPFLFDNMFGHEVKNNRVDFYEALLKYRLCYFGGSISDSVSDLITYANNS